mgnify:FL=1|tara:strand:+ start:412 stop:603 length:192 start_codon:yes stop_codon:yes gene_type:complete
MGNSCKKKIEEFSCKSSCSIEKEIKEIKKYFQKMSLDDLIHLKEYMEKRNEEKELKIKIESLL